MAASRIVPSGHLLLAWPAMSDPNFARAVVLLCQHEARGAYGLILNRPKGQRVRDLVPKEHLLGGLPHPVYEGGPVDGSRLQYLHALPAAVPGGLRVGEDLYLGGDLERLVGVLRAVPEPLELPVRFFLGYSGWGEGQLEGELAEGSWFPARGGCRRVFASTDLSAWERIVDELGMERALGETRLDVHGN